MEVILLKHLENLGHRGDVVRVLPGYARNFLLPRRVAILATPGTMRLVGQGQRKFEAVDSQARGEAGQLAARLAALELSFAVKADEDGKLFGSVSALDVCTALAQNAIHLERKQIALEQPIKQLGNYDVGIRLHADVRGTVKVQVVQE